jgi:hypothetical protein
MEFARRAVWLVLAAGVVGQGFFAGGARAGAAEDAFAAGYAAAVLERDFGLLDPDVSVSDGVLRVRASDLRSRDLDAMAKSLKRIEGIRAVEIADGAGEVLVSSPPAPTAEAADRGVVVFPGHDLFDPPIADQRWPHFSVIWQYYLDDDELGNVGATSFGETFPLVRWPGASGGGIEVGIQGGVFSIFDLDAPSADLINSDFLGGIFASYRTGDVSATLRVYHQSSHLGDEFLLRNRAERVNLSYEAVEALLSYDARGVLRVYGGGGVLVHVEPEDIHPLSAQVGAELWSPEAFLGDLVRPLAALDVQAREESGWKPDYSARVGVELASPALRRMRLQLLLEYYDGRSPNGQFFAREIDSLGVGAHLQF